MSVYSDINYRFADEAEARAVLAAYLIADPETGVLVWSQAGEGYALDPVGVLWEPTGEVDGEGQPVLAPLDGWHVNLRTWGGHAAPTSHRVTPEAPRRVWLD